MPRVIPFTLAFFFLFLLIYVLIVGQGIFIPFLIALVIAYFILALAKGIQKLSIRGKRLPYSLAFIGSISILLGGIYLIFFLMSNSVSALLESAPLYQQKLAYLIQQFFDLIGEPLPNFSNVFKKLDLSSLITTLLFMLTGIAGQTGMIAIYLIFILLESRYFENKLLLMFRTKEGKESTKQILKKIVNQIQSYVMIKTLLGLLTALCSYAILETVGIDFADFWALLIFLFNYIPTIGAIVATILPCLLTLLQFGRLVPFLVVTIGLTSIQFVIGNIIEPKIMGKQFNLSGVVIILSLAIWGQIWGVIGMFLCVPFMMIINIILSNFSQTRPIAILLSQTGKLAP